MHFNSSVISQSIVTSVFILFANLGSFASTDVRLDPVFRDHAVLQRGREVAVRGRAMPSEKISVSFGSMKVEGVAGADGRFLVLLPAMEAALEPRELIVSTASGEVRVQDVLVGEVWICSGQSNMEWSVDASNEATRAKEIAAKLPIRSFKAPHVTANRPSETVPGEWRVATQETVGSFTAIGWWFGVDLARAFDLKVPIGLVDISWGGTRIEPWIPLDVMAKSDFKSTADKLSAQIAAFEATTPDSRDIAAAKELVRFNSARTEYWNKAFAGEIGAKENWSMPERESNFPAGWAKTVLPAFFTEVDKSIERFDGFVWFTREFEVPAAMASKPCILWLPPIDDGDRVTIDGVEVGSTIGNWTAPRAYEIPSGLTSGIHRITIAVLDMHGEGGIAPGAMRLGLEGSYEEVSLAGEWLWRKGGGVPRLPVPSLRDVTKGPGTEPHEPAAIFNAMMAPCIAYPARGVLWYQGESNAGEPAKYAQLLPLLIQSWREKSGNPDLAWGVVQLAGFMPFIESEPAQGAWALLRQAQLDGVKAAGNAGLASAIDLGDAADIHPKRKREVADRLAAWARNTVYGEKSVAWQGPEIAKAARENGSKVRLRFVHADGLHATSGEPGGFALAGVDGKFVWAKAMIMDGGRDGIVLSAPGVADPVEVVYAWQNNPEHANIVNRAEIPMLPFRMKIQK
ncbi:MAG: hypothetical protein O3B75_05270 [Planctomycetota bacterium]|nr:hypothetical protein [Planctomycetota bacterium]